MKTFKTVLMGMLLANSAVIAQTKTGPLITVSGTIERGIEQTSKYVDSVYLRINHDYSMSDAVVISQYFPEVIYAAPIVEGKFVFKIKPTGKLMQYELSHKRNGGGDHDEYIIQPSDVVDFHIGSEGTIFSGQGKLKAQLRYDIDQILRSAEYNPLLHQIPDNNQYAKQLKYFEVANIKQNRMLKLLNDHKSRLDSEVYHRLYAQVIGATGLAAAKGFSMSAGGTKFTKEQSAVLMDTINKFFQFGDHAAHGDAYARSKIYLDYIRYRYSAEKKLTGSIKKHFDYYKQTFQGRLRNTLTANYYIMSYQMFDNPDSLLNEIKQVVKDPVIVNALDKKNGGIKIGRQAPDFALTGVDGKTVSLSDFRGKTVILDFWYTGCPGCTQQYQNVISKVEPKYVNNKDVVFITVSIDKDKRDWIGSIKGGLYTSTRAINLFTNGQTDKHPVIRAYEIMAYPASFIIDKKGNIVANKGSFNSPELLISTIEKASAEPELR